uniref:Uncharacterized protein n=1 Tax=Cannabis sativa TaxID=3483 RepID=A0A803PB62_CANSA
MEGGILSPFSASYETQTLKWRRMETQIFRGSFGFQWRTPATVWMADEIPFGECRVVDVEENFVQLVCPSRSREGWVGGGRLRSSCN